jgi:transmembrane sensor
VKDDFNDSVKELITKYLADEASSEEAHALQDWITQAPENERQYLAYKKVFELSQQHYAQKAEETHTVDIDQEWNHFMNNIRERAVEPETKVRMLEKPSHSLWYKVAAAVLLVAVSGWIITKFVGSDEDVTYQTASNTMTVKLPDGSQVILNRNSELSYSASFDDKNRTVVLEGEAFFDVAPNPQKPFIIQANDARVEVVGTSFNVLAYDSMEDVEVVVQSGVVTLSGGDLKSEVKLQAGDKGIYSKASHQLSSGVNKDINFLSWNTRKIVFTEDDLRTVVATLNKTYHTNISIAADIPASCVVTVTFDQQSLNAVLNVLETTLNLTFRTNGNRIEITAAGC